jgi:hypothetical protein
MELSPMTTLEYRTQAQRIAAMTAVARSAHPEGVSNRKLLWAAPVAGLAAAAGNLAVFGVARASLDLPLVMPAMGPSPAGPLAAAPVVVSSFVPALLAGLLLALLARFSTRPVRVFQVVAGAALVLSFGAPLTTPLDLSTRLVLLTMHLAAGLVITGVLSALATE